MKLSYIFALTVAQLLASASVVEIRQSANPSQIDCVEAQKYIGVYNGFSQACVNLVRKLSFLPSLRGPGSHCRIRLQIA